LQRQGALLRGLSLVAMDGRGAAVLDEPSESPQQKIKDRVVHGKLNRAKEIKN